MMNKSAIYLCFGLLITSALISCTSCSEQTTNQRPEEPLRLLWSYEYSQQVDGLSSVTLRPEIINTPTSSIITALDRQFTSLSQEDGKLLWQQQTPDNQAIFVNRLNADNQKIYGKNDRGSIYYAVDLQSGAMDWQKINSKGEFYDYAQDDHDDQYLYLAGKDSVLYVFDKQEGGYQDTIHLQHYARAVVSDGQNLYISQAWKPDSAESAFSRIISLDRQTHRTNWSYQTTTGGFYYADLVLKDGILYTGATSGPSVFVALDATTGQVEWELEGYWCYRFTIGDGKIFINDSNYVLAVDQKTGEVLWEDYFQGHTESNLAYMDGYLYHTHNGGLYIWDAQNGNRVAGPIESPNGSDFYNLNAGNDKVFVQSDFHLYAYEAFNEK